MRQTGVASFLSLHFTVRGSCRFSTVLVVHFERLNFEQNIFFCCLYTNNFNMHASNRCDVSTRPYTA